MNAGDVAVAAGVSRSAVSRTFTPGASVAPATRQRVLDAAKAVGYNPARKLPAPDARGDRPVAVIMANMRSPYFAELSALLDRELANAGLRAVFTMCADVARVDMLVDDWIARGVQGIVILSAAPSPKTLAAAAVARVPVVLLDRSEQTEGASLVWVDGPETGRAVARLMLDEGRRRPVVLSATPLRSRELSVFAETMEAAGSAPCRWMDTGWDYINAARAATLLLAEGDCDWPDALFAASDTLAIGFLDAARAGGVDVPGDISVMGFGNTASSDWLSHDLSSVRLPIVPLIQTAVATLLARIGDSGEPAPRIWLGCDVVARGTTLPLAQALTPPR